MNDAGGSRAQLAGFLRTRRAHVDRAVVGLPASRRTPGLRREEVAALSGVSITWYTWLEQARPINPSRQVLDAIARTLRLTAAEHAYMLSLAGLTDTWPESTSGSDRVSSLLDALTGSPAFTLAEDWTITVWNAAYAALYPPIVAATPTGRNLLRAVYLDPFVRDLLPDWSVTSSRFLAEFRAEVGPRLDQPTIRALVDDLAEASEQFRQDWSRYDIQGFASRRRSFDTRAGRLEFDHHRLSTDAGDGVHVVAYTAADPTTARRLRRLMKTLPTP